MHKILQWCATGVSRYVQEVTAHFGVVLLPPHVLQANAVAALAAASALDDDLAAAVAAAAVRPSWHNAT
jgi:hypothetical protein